MDARYECIGGRDAAGDLVVDFRLGDVVHPEASDVALTRFSTGSDFHPVERPTPVEIRVGGPDIG